MTSHRRRATPTGVRTDIQALRAIAVSMVLVFHIWPGSLPGGYVGVDVFFVISGFLITSHLLAHPPRNARGLLEFWSRRVRRLLPASLLVLAVSLLLTRLFVPDTLWANTAAQIRAAALYFVNWRLAAENSDYLGAHDAPTVARHFWSLSVEEQFYLVWPIIIFLVVAVAVWRRWRVAPTVGVALAAVVAASFWYSVHYTALEPARAYYVTPTRMWELGVGGMLAVALSARAVGTQRDGEAIPGPDWTRTLLAWAGLAAIAWTGLAFDSHDFPGSKAAVPVLGTAAVIAAYAPSRLGSPGPLMAVRPVQWLGNVSYSVYLWHWPLIVVLPYVVDNPGDSDRLAVVALTLVLAGLTKVFVEDRFRTAKWGNPLPKPFAVAALGMLVVVGAAQAQTVQVQHRVAESSAAVHAALRAHKPCFGAAASRDPATCAPTTSGTLTPTPLQAVNDKSDAYKGGVAKSENCFAYVPDFTVKTCEFGDTTSAVNVALVGNSHAGQWLPALEQVAKKRHWKVTTYLASQCAFADLLQTWDTRTHARSCLAWVHSVERRLSAGHYDLVVMTNRVSVTAWGHSLEESQPLYEQGYVDVLSRLSAAHVKLVGIRDTPFPRGSVPDCLAVHSDDYAACDGPLAKWLPREPLTAAMLRVNDPRMVYADLTEYLCPKGTCHAVIGNVPVYADGSHMTATFNTTLAPYLEPYLVRALAA